MFRFIHTADWQIGKRYSRVENSEKQATLRQERIRVIGRIGQVARDHKAQFILVAGDLFDSTTPVNSTVSSTCKAIGDLEIPVLVIPGNHDHSGPGSCWEQDYFLSEQGKLAPNLKVLTRAEPVEVAGAFILPCPLCRKQESDDLTSWLHRPEAFSSIPDDAIRIVLAHGSTQGFSSCSDGEESVGQSNLLRIERLDTSAVDYIALGDWHGTKEVGAKAWYSGTPELDRFVKGGDHDPGNVLAVTIGGRGANPVVEKVRTAKFGWYELAFTLMDDGSLPHLQYALEALIGDRVEQDLVRLTLEGSIGIAGEQGLSGIKAMLEGRLLRLKLDNRIMVEPTQAEIQQLSSRAGDPLVSDLAGRLKVLQESLQDAEIARLALRDLYIAVNQASKGSRA